MSEAEEVAFQEFTDRVEAETRRLRDAVYGKPITDQAWEDIKHHWLADVAWLRQKAITQAVFTPL